MNTHPHPLNSSATQVINSDADTAMLAALPVDKGAEADGPNCSQARLPKPMSMQTRATVDRRRLWRVRLLGVVLLCASAVISVLGLFMPDSLLGFLFHHKSISATTALTLAAAAMTFSASHIARS